MKIKWDEAYMHAYRYKNENGDLDVPIKYVTEDGYALGHWISQMRQGMKKGELTKEQIIKLNAIGMIWNTYEYKWNQSFDGLLKYYKQHNSYENLKNDDNQLYEWKSKQNTAFRNKRLSKNQIDRLSQIQAITDIVLEEEWDFYYKLMRVYIKSNGNDIAVDYVDLNGYKLGRWARNQRRNYWNGSLVSQKIKKLKSIGFCFAPLDEIWDKMYELCKRNKQLYGYIFVCGSKEEYQRLKEWLSTQKKAKRQGKLSKERLDKLNLLDARWFERNDAQKTSFPEQSIYYILLNNLGTEVLNRYKLNGNEIDVFVPDFQGKTYAFEYDGSRFHDLSKASKDIEKIEMCKQNGIHLIRFREERCPVLSGYEDHVIVVESNMNFSSKFNFLKLSLEKIFKTSFVVDDDTYYADLLIASTNANASRWWRMLHLAEEYYAEFKTCTMRQKQEYKGCHLGQWISDQRKKLNNTSRGKPLDSFQIKALNALGIKAGIKKCRKYDDEETLKLFINWTRKHNSVECFGCNILWEGEYLGYRLTNLRKRYRNMKNSNKNLIKPKIIEAFDNAGMIWKSKNDYEWNKKYNVVKSYIIDNGVLCIGRRIRYNGVTIDTWIAKQRTDYKKGKLSPDRIKKLQFIGII